MVTTLFFPFLTISILYILWIFRNIFSSKLRISLYQIRSKFRDIILLWHPHKTPKPLTQTLLTNSIQIILESVITVLLYLICSEQSLFKVKLQKFWTWCPTFNWIRLSTTMYLVLPYSLLIQPLLREYCRVHSIL